LFHGKSNTPPSWLPLEDVSSFILSTAIRSFSVVTDWLLWLHGW